jgi:transglutaminase-like putative cysteine protease
LVSIPGGLEGVRATLKIMVQYVHSYRTDVDVRELAIRLTAQCPARSLTCEYTQLQHFVRDHIRYVRDVRDVETLQTPKATLRLAAGDCDDQAVLLATMLESIGARTRFEALGVRGGGYEHVISAVQAGVSRSTGKPCWVPLETIFQTDPRMGTAIEPGWLPPDTTRIMLAHN